MTELLSPLKTDWTEADLQHLPDGYLYEIVDGRLLVTPPAKAGHQTVARDMLFRLLTGVPKGWDVLYEIGIALGENRFVPDIAVLSPGVVLADVEYNAVRPELVVEVASRSTVTTDRGDKLVAYADAGIPAYWRVELDGSVVVYALAGESYEVVAKVASGESIDLTEPFPVTVVAPRR
ncbi:Uma2 family endonuclease [Antribacter gilvus]|uniref:Uma2 family endonuclease n=1 Tax=Antribacter gilvus TaxID=2304675 RepID=UPI0013E0493E|nr:Uma2 family endonuclease [Antribacter gilvus]